uniref:BUD13 homolog n=1 Tax=Clastoptera arizonana TaxID=38151 RepID=A0A1B6DQY3_9HEMI
MTSASVTISQKEYLKKYLSGSDKIKKKKKKQKIVASNLKRSKIIDDDLDLKNMRVLNDDEVDIYQLDEDAPIIAGIIDDRPPEIKAREYYDNRRWKVFAADDDLTVIDQQNIETSKTPLQSTNQEKESRNRQSDSDMSPPQNSSKIKKKSNNSHKTKSSDSDLSPPRKVSERPLKSKFINQVSKERSDSDFSTSRKYSSTYLTNTSSRYHSDSDLSPPRNTSNIKRYLKNSKIEKSSDSDLSPPRKNSERHLKTKSSKYQNDSDQYLHNRKGADFNKTVNSKRKGSDSDLSPIRTNSGKHSKNEVSRRHNDFDKSQYIRQDTRSIERKGSSTLNSASKHVKYKHSETNTNKPNISQRSFEILKDNKLEKTLDGKRAGLQDAKHLRKELADFKEKEDQQFAKMKASVSGEGAAPVMRDRKTGKIRDLNEEKLIDEEKVAKDEARKEKYSRWGKGLKQVEDAAEKLADTIKEMSKPLARYADDKDLDNFLKAQEREGDPMLDYIKRKQGEAIALSGKKPQYQGSFAPNRFGIHPGHRWDGVDRSNGYEKKWFTHQNAKKARDEEAYKWSTSDM